MRNKLKEITDLNIPAGSKVVLRLDLNVPTDEQGEITNDFRIQESMPTILQLKNLGAKIIIIAHKEEGSLEKIGKYLKEKLAKENINFHFISQTGSTELQNSSEYQKLLEANDVLLLENVRNDKREKSKNPDERDELGKIFAGFGDFYVNEAFSASHRDHASITSVPKFLPSCLGPKFINEIEKLTLALNPIHPSFLLVGGAKFDTKLPMIEKFLNISDKIFVGGALAHSFWKTKNYELGTSLVDNEVVLGDKVLAAEKSGQIILPTDVLTDDKQNKNPDQIDKLEMVVDFGPKTLEIILDTARNSKTIVWNGPVDLYEKGFDWGTKELIENFSKIIKEDPTKNIILGGGDTVTEIDRVKATNPDIKFTHVSTGGGAMIDFLSTGTLPGIDAIK